MNPIPGCAALLSALVVAGDLSAAEPFRVGGPGVRASDFQITVFASGLNYPKGMQRLSDGSLLVATSDPTGTSKGFYSSTGTLIRLEDRDGDGVADGPPQQLFTGLPGSLSGLHLAGELVLVISTARQLSVLRSGASPGDPLTLSGKILFQLPDRWGHPPSDLAVRQAPARPGSWEVFFQLGSRDNFAASTIEAALSSDLGIGTAPLAGDSIHRLTLTDQAGRVSASGPTRIARGLRNPAGFAFHPSTGDLYFQDNGIDGLSDPNEPLSADELNLIAAGDLGAEVPDFGFPSSYVAYRTGTVAGGEGFAPLVAFQPLPDPQTGEESEGPAEIAFAPPLFPAGLRKGIFLGFHGKFNQGGLQNEENPLVFLDLATLGYFPFVGNDEPGVGHLDGLLSAGDSLFVADIASTGSMSTGAGTGVIYQVRSLLPPPALFLRGDASGDGVVDLSDPVATLAYLFLGQTGLPCLDAADANDDGAIDLSDAVAVLFSLFADGRELPPPVDTKGEDPTPDALDCSGGV